MVISDENLKILGICAACFGGFHFKEKNGCKCFCHNTSDQDIKKLANRYVMERLRKGQKIKI